MSAPGDFTPPEFPSGVSQSQDSPEEGGGPPGVRPGVAAGILAGVVALGVVAVFAVGQAKSGGSALVAKPGVTATVPGSARTSDPTSASTSSPNGAAPATGSGGSVPTGSGSTAPAGVGGGTGSGDPSPTGTSTGAYMPEFYVGQCVDTTGSGTDFTVSAAGCQGADYKIIYSFQNQSGDVDSDMSQCYSINGSDNEFENGDPDDGYTLYCMNSLTGEFSPRRAQVDNCLDSTAAYEVDCTSSKATWIVIGRLNGTNDTKNCSQFGSYDTSYFWTAAPPFVLCVDKYAH